MAKSESDHNVWNIGIRIYSYRCSIAHAKGDVDEYIAIPTMNNEDIATEIPLIKYIAFQVLKESERDRVPLLSFWKIALQILKIMFFSSVCALLVKEQQN